MIGECFPRLKNMDKVRFACPRCKTIMQASADKLGHNVACPHCAHQFRLVGSSDAPTVRRSDSDLSAAGSDPNGLESSGGDSEIRPQSKLSRPDANHLDSCGVPQELRRSPLTLPNAGFSCPYCQTTQPPTWKSEVSTIGWIVFAILLVTTCFFCFVGLFIRDRFRVCSQCKIRLE